MTTTVKLLMPEQPFNDWMAALRSDIFTQGRGFFKYIAPDGAMCHCAFGVLLEIMNVPSKPKHDRTCYEFELGAFNSASWVNDQWCVEHNVDACLVWHSVNLNDGEGWSFKQIADKLENMYDEAAKGQS